MQISLHQHIVQYHIPVEVELPHHLMFKYLQRETVEFQMRVCMGQFLIQEEKLLLRLSGQMLEDIQKTFITVQSLHLEEAECRLRTMVPYHQVEEAEFHQVGVEGSHRRMHLQHLGSVGLKL